jgi:hypothetical protein
MWPLHPCYHAIFSESAVTFCYDRKLFKASATGFIFIQGKGGLGWHQSLPVWATTTVWVKLLTSFSQPESRNRVRKIRSKQVCFVRKPSRSQCYKTFLSVLTNFRTNLECVLK